MPLFDVICCKIWMFLKTEEKKKPNTNHTHLRSALQPHERIAVTICIMDSASQRNSE